MSCAASLTAFAQTANDVFQLPDDQARETYEVDIEAVLRERYRQKVETSAKESILQRCRRFFPVLISNDCHPKKTITGY
ncbi:MAG TPA: hypothetical protein VJU84_03830 [Pyrinomonadaceae bacterium]|nr:hypothetical protein [Pyrinomonadaceae bacterium]